jgi:CSLREA domain-containing protein
MNRIALVLLLLAVFPGVPGVAGATVFDVTKTADTLDGACDADCSLREAVAAANAHSGEDLILLGPGVYTLTREGAFEDSGATGDLDVTEDLMILGAGAARTLLDGGSLDRVLQSHAGTTLEIHDLTIRNGWAQSRTSPTPIAGTGGGVSGLSIVLIDTLVTGNRAEDGGGVWAVQLTARGTTISNNVAYGNGGGVSSAPGLDLRNVTISGNTANDNGGGLYLFPGDKILEQVTVTANTAYLAGGIMIEPLACPGSCPTFKLHLANSAIAGNRAASLPDCSLPASDAGHNVFADGYGCSPGPTDRAGTEGAPLEVNFSLLGDHGGPTPTHLPLAGSPVLGFASGCSATDQRGAARPAEGCDAGAVELSSVCLPGAASLCLQDGRFRVTAIWKITGGQGTAQAVPLTSDTGSFWFFNRANLELTLKVLDGCAVNGRFWVFVTGLTDVEVEIRVEDTQTHEVRTYANAGKTTFQPRLDTNAFDCP